MLQREVPADLAELLEAKARITRRHEADLITDEELADELAKLEVVDAAGVRWAPSPDHDPSEAVFVAGRPGAEMRVVDVDLYEPPTADPDGRSEQARGAEAESTGVSAAAGSPLGLVSGVPPEVTKRVALVVAGAWVAFLTGMAALTAVALSFVPVDGLPVLAPALWLAHLGLGGSVVGSTGANIAGVSGSGAVSLSFVFATLPLAAWIMLRFGRRRFLPELPDPKGVAAIAGVTGAAVVAASSAFASQSVEIDAVAASVSVGWLRSALVAGLLSAAAFGGWDVLRTRLPDLAWTSVLRGGLLGMLRLLLGVAVLASAVAVLRGSATGDPVGLWTLLGGWVAALVALPTLLAALLAFLSGAGASASATASGGLAFIADFTREASAETVRAPLPVVLGVGVVAAVWSAWRHREPEAQSATRWWQCAALFASVAPLVWAVTRASVSGDAGATLLTDLRLSGVGSVGFHLFELILRFAAFGAIVGLAAHPAVQSVLTPAIRPLGSLVSGVRSLVAQVARPVRPLVSTASRVVGTGPRAAAVGMGCIIASFFAVSLAGAALDRVALVVMSSPGDKASAYADALRDGDGERWASLEDSSSVPISSSGVEVTVERLESEDDRERFELRWGDGNGEYVVVSFLRSSDARFGLLRGWDDGYVEGGLPTVSVSDWGYEDELEVSVSGVAVTSPPLVMPGEHEVVVSPSHGLASAFSTKVQVTSYVEVEPTFGLTDAGEESMKEVLEQYVEDCADPGSTSTYSTGSWCPSTLVAAITESVESVYDIRISEAEVVDVNRRRVKVTGSGTAMVEPYYYRYSYWSDDTADDVPEDYRVSFQVWVDVPLLGPTEVDDAGFTRVGRATNR